MPSEEMSYPSLPMMEVMPKRQVVSVATEAEDWLVGLADTGLINNPQSMVEPIILKNIENSLMFIPVMARKWKPPREIAPPPGLICRWKDLPG